MLELAALLVFAGTACLAGRPRHALHCLVAAMAFCAAWTAIWYASSWATLLVAIPPDLPHSAGIGINALLGLVSWLVAAFFSFRLVARSSGPIGLARAAILQVAALAPCYASSIYRLTRGGGDEAMIDIMTMSLAALWALAAGRMSGAGKSAR